MTTATEGKKHVHSLIKKSAEATTAHDAQQFAQAACNSANALEVMRQPGEMKISIITEEQINHMVYRFLGWKLPANFVPDCGISFKPDFNEHTDHPMKHEPSGTNLFDAVQADAMVRYMIEGLA